MQKSGQEMMMIGNRMVTVKWYKMVRLWIYCIFNLKPIKFVKGFRYSLRKIETSKMIPRFLL